jgi:hypothetical protein
MVVQHLMGLSPITAITAVITSASVAGFRTWTWLRRCATAEHARTLRLVAALRCAPGRNHAEVVRALAELEAAIGNAASPAAKPRRPPQQSRTIPMLAARDRPAAPDDDTFRWSGSTGCATARGTP